MARVVIRRERAGDVAAIDAVHRQAFANSVVAVGGGGVAAEPAEVGLVHALRADDSWVPTLSLVAEQFDGVIGHVCLNRAVVGPFPVLALGPLAVVPDAQRQGVGAALVYSALGAADALDQPLVGVLGSLEYYPRFGFVPGGRLGIRPDVPGWTEHFQVCPLSSYQSDITGEFRYAAPFYAI